MMFKSVEQIRDAVISCTDCKLCQSRNNAVAGKGNHSADVIFVGEAPGSNEDKTGEPFVGAAGRKLTAALRHAGISRESIYITNAVKCRPPGNRVPAQDEIDACRKYMDYEIGLIRPKVVCIMGNFAYRHLLGGTRIIENRGKVVQRDGQTYFLTIHPAAAVYRSRLTVKLNEDMIALANMIR